MDRVQQRLRLAQAAKQEAQGRPSTVEYKAAIAAAAQQLQSWKMEAQDLRKRANMVMQAACSRTISSAQVVTSTCSGAGDKSLADTIFRVVLVDEASQATEPSIMVPLTRGPECVILAGDPLQLPPTVISTAALKFGLDRCASCHHLTATHLYPCLSCEQLTRTSRHSMAVVRELGNCCVLCSCRRGTHPTLADKKSRVRRLQTCTGRPQL
jgi:hypothetical protein